MNVLILIASIVTNHNNGLFPRYVQKCASRLTIVFSLGNQIEIEAGSGSKKMEEIKPSKRQWIFSMVLLWPYPLQANHQTSEIFIVNVQKKSDNKAKRRNPLNKQKLWHWIFKQKWTFKSTLINYSKRSIKTWFTKHLE